MPRSDFPGIPAFSHRPMGAFSRLGRTLALMAAGLGLIAAAHAQILLVSNLDAEPSGDVHVTMTYEDQLIASYRGIAFTTGNTYAHLSSITLRMNGGAGGSFSLHLYPSGTETILGPHIETLDGSSNPASADDYTYLSAGTVLDPNTTYWMVAEVWGVGNDYALVATSSHAQTGQPGWSIGDSHIFSDGGGWIHLDGSEPVQFAVYGTPFAVPEPSTYAVIAGGTMLALAAWRRRRSRAKGAAPTF